MFDGHNSLECRPFLLSDNATCHGDVTAFTASIAVCNEHYLVNVSDLVEITGSLRLTFLSSGITALSFDSLAVIGQDLYVADIDATTTTLSFPSLLNVSGGITFSNAYIETTELLALRMCSGSLSVTTTDYNSVTNVYFPFLEEVSGAMDFDGRAIRTIELPSLLVVGGSASFSSLYYMNSIAMPAIRAIGGGLSINALGYFLSGSASLDIHSLESIGGEFYIRDIEAYPSLTTINATRLQTLGSLDFNSLTSLAELSMPSLITVQGDLHIDVGFCGWHCDGALAIDGNAMTTVAFDSLTMIQGQLYMRSVTVMTTVAFGSLTTIQGSLYISEFGALTTVVFDSLTTVEGYVYISGGTLLATAYFNSLTSVGQTVSCDVSGEYENVCIRDSAALNTVAFRSLEYDSFDIATPSGAPV